MITESHCWKYFKGHTGYDHPSPSDLAPLVSPYRPPYSQVLSCPVSLRLLSSLENSSLQIPSCHASSFYSGLCSNSMLSWRPPSSVTLRYWLLSTPQPSQSQIPWETTQDPDVRAFRGALSGTTPGRAWRKQDRWRSWNAVRF